VCPTNFHTSAIPAPLHGGNARPYRVKKLRRYTNSQCFSSSTLMTPHLFFRPRTLLPSITTVRSEPTTAKGIIPYYASPQSRVGTTGVFAYPDLGVDLNLLLVCLLGVEGVQANVVVNEFGTDLHNQSRLTHAIHTGIHCPNAIGELTFCLNATLSSIVKLSDLAITGTTFTTSLNFFNTTISIARSECPEGLMKNRAQ